MYESFLKIFWDEVFVVGHSVFSIQYSAVIFSKRSEFEIQFYLIVLLFKFYSSFKRSWERL